MSPPEESAGVLDATETRTVQRPWHAAGDDRIAFFASWDTYQLLVEALDEQHVLLAYDGERIELMSPGYRHEDFKVLSERLVGALAAELGLPCKGAGSTRWRRPAAKRGVEADASFYFTAEKIRIARRRSRDEADWPIPDLAIELDMSPSQIDRPGIYSALGVPEVWRFDGETVRIDRLGPDGRFADAPESQFLGVRAEELTFLLREVADLADDDNDFSRRVTEWARNVLLPRRAGGA